ncbi:MAG: TetR/AcrR family transcriptional regulator [Anaerolineae bacterium]|nr:TetR/AcrR family transcriptional regulator [Anaerolineae bacterium]
MSETRRERQREATREEIKATARRLLAEQGTAGLSIRAIAREIGLTPPALYRYFASLDDLVTALIVDVFTALAEQIEAARDCAGPQAPPSAKLMNVLRAYRRWAVDNPADFGLIYGTPIAGYHAPREITVPVVIRGFAVIVGLLEEMTQQEEIIPVPSMQMPPPGVEASLQAMIEGDGYPVSVAALYMGTVGWTQFHGIISLEVFGHLPPVVGDTNAFFEAQLRNILIGMGWKG